MSYRYLPLLFLFSCGTQVSPLADSGLVDNDGDGYDETIDCDDNNPEIKPDGNEIDCDDGLDNDCDDIIDLDPECPDPCELAVQRRSYVGCELYAADLPQNTPNKLYAIAFANYSFTHMATVEVSHNGNILQTLQIPPRGLDQFIEVQRPRNISVGDAGVSNLSYHIQSDRPLAAYQFNSWDTIGAASTDASLLLPVHAYDTDYISMSYTSSMNTSEFITIVASEDNTQLSAPASATLNKGQVYTLFGGATGTDLTGTLVTADKPIAVFSGNRGVRVPNAIVYLDHIEQQMLPRSAHGKEFVVPRTRERVPCMAPDHIRVLAEEDGTQVIVEGASQPIALNKGMWEEFTTTESLNISANKALTVGLFLRSSGGTACSNEGDPFFVELPAIEQYRTDYLFMTPPTYDSDYIAIIASPGSTVTLDGSPMTVAGENITGWTVMTVEVQDGAHSISSDSPFGLIVYGFGGGPGNQMSQNVSYGYAGGLDVERINVVD